MFPVNVANFSNAPTPLRRGEKPGRMMGSMSLRAAALAIGISFALAASPADAKTDDPIAFFAGRTESIGTVKVAMKKPFRSRAVGKGEILADGSLLLVQRVEDQGEQPKQRRWKMRRTSPGHYTGTMTEARGPVNVEEVGGRYRFHFRMDGNIAVEQWLTPSADGRSARSQVVIRKFGVRVGGSDAVIRKLD